MPSALLLFSPLIDVAFKNAFEELIFTLLTSEYYYLNKDVNIKLEKIVNKLNSFTLPKKHLYYTACIIIISLLTMSFLNIQKPIYRIINHNQQFSAPLPFDLFS